jgi:hypothetical protein
VGTAGADGLGAGAEGGDGHLDRDDKVRLVGICIHFKDHAVVEQAFRACGGCGLGAEVGEAELDVGFSAWSFFISSRGMAAMEATVSSVPCACRTSTKAAHVRAFVLVRQINGEGDGGDGVLHGLIAIADAQGEAQAADADPVDGERRSSRSLCVSWRAEKGWKKIPLPLAATVGKEDSKGH